MLKLAESRFALAFGIERLGGELAIGLLEQNFHAAFSLFELLLAFAGKGHAFFEELHGIIERELGAFEAADDLFEAGERALKIGLLWRFRFFGGG
jgi:hypothetical protein